MKKVISIILEVIIVLLIFWFILGYINFGKITDGKEPLYVVKENTYDNLRRENSIRYCEYCGAQLDVNDKFCPNCGSSRSK